MNTFLFHRLTVLTHNSVRHFESLLAGVKESEHLFIYLYHSVFV